MANVQEWINKIRSAIYGEEVRSSIANSIEAMNVESSEAVSIANNVNSRQTSLEKQYEQQIKNMTLKDPSSAEIVAMRTSVNGTTYDTAGARVDSIEGDSNKTIRKLDNIISANLFSAKTIEETPNFNSTTAIQNAINSGDYGSIVVLSPGTYIVEKLLLKDGVSIFAPGVTLKMKSGTTGGLINLGKKKDILISGLILDGGVTTDYTTSSEEGSRFGIQIYNNSQRVVIENCSIRGFDGYGIKITETGYSTVHGKAVKINNTDVEYCYYGIDLGSRGEYCQLVNVTTTKNRIGLRTIGSNTQCTNVHCNDNVDGLHLDFVSGGNDSHSLFSNCSFNHNTNYSILAKNFNVGVSFVGCHSHANTNGIRLENCSGFTWSAGEIRVTPITVVGGGYNRFDNNIFDKTAITQSGGYTEFRDNIKPDGTIDSNRSNTPTYFISRSVSSSISNITEETVIPFQSGSNLLFGNTNTDLYNGSTGIGKITSRGVYSLSACLVVDNKVAATNTVTLKLYKNNIVTKALTYKLEASETSVFLNLDLIDLFNSYDTFKVTLTATKYVIANNNVAAKLVVVKL